MSVHSGKWGVVNGASTVRNWSINDTHTPQTYVASNTRFGTGRRRGIEDWNGNYAFYGHTPPVMPGETFTFLGYTAPDDDVSGNGNRYTGSALVENVQINWNWQGGEILNGVVNFQGNLALTHEESGADIDDLTVPTVPPIADTRIMYLQDGFWKSWDTLVSANLTITSALQTYVNSGTIVIDGSTKRIWTGRKCGPIDWSLQVTDQDVQRSNLFTKGEIVGIRLYVSVTQYWQLMWGQVQEFTGITVDRETGAIIQKTVPINASMMDPDAGTYDASVGSIRRPADSASNPWWPGETLTTFTTGATTTSAATS